MTVHLQFPKVLHVRAHLSRPDILHGQPQPRQGLSQRLVAERELLACLFSLGGLFDVFTRS